MRSARQLLLLCLLTAAPVLHSTIVQVPDPRSRRGRSTVVTSESHTDVDALAGLGAVAIGAGGDAWRELWFASLDEVERLERPSLNNSHANVTAQLGSSAFLHCHVRNHGERGVSWIRRRDWHILSSGVSVYTNDERFQILHSEGSDDWTLQIKYVQKRDNGTYECQVSTGGGVVSHFVHLQIVVPEAFILGSGEHHVDVGSLINLVCIIEKSPTPPQYVFWYHNERMINYDTARGGIAVETEPGPKTQSRLAIRDAAHTDSGNYTCSASNTEPASIYVFVSEGDKMAAILRRKTNDSTHTTSSLSLLVSCFTVLYITRHSQ